MSVDVQKRRVAELIELGSQLAGEFASHFLWKENEILVENIGDGCVEGLTPAYLKARVDIGDLKPQKGDLLRFIARSWHDDALVGERIV